MTAPAARLLIEDLHVTIARRPVVAGVSLRLAPGRIVALVGASGSGKTMTGLAVLDLLPPGAAVRGTIRVDGAPLATGDHRADPAAIPPARLRGSAVATIWQQPRRSLHPMLRIAAQLDEVLRRHARPAAGDSVRGRRARRREAAVRLLSDAGIEMPEAILPAYAHELSGGQAERVAIALALAGRPSVLLADEPTTALDVLTQAGLLRHLHHLARTRGIGILLVTHDVHVVAEIADEACILEAGRVVESGDVTAIFDRPSHAATRQLLAGVGPDAAPSRD